MRNKKYYIALDDFERSVVVNCLNETQNKLIAGGKVLQGRSKLTVHTCIWLISSLFSQEKDFLP